MDDPVDHAQRGLNCRAGLGGADARMQLNLQGMEQSKAAPRPTVARTTRACCDATT